MKGPLSFVILVCTVWSLTALPQGLLRTQFQLDCDHVLWRYLQFVHANSYKWVKFWNTALFPCVLRNAILMWFYHTRGGLNPFLVTSAKLRKAIVSFVMSVCTCPSVRMNNSAPTGRIFLKFDIWVFLEFYIHGPVHRESNLLTVRQDATYPVYYFSVGSSTCFGCWHPSSGAGTAVITACGID